MSLWLSLRRLAERMGVTRLAATCLYEVAVKASVFLTGRVFHVQACCSPVSLYWLTLSSSASLQYPKEASLDHRPAFLLEFIMTAKVKVRFPVAV